MISYFSLIKTLHICCVILSFAGFLFRGLLVYRQSPLLKHPGIRYFPHLNDSLLFIFGISLAFILFPSIKAIPLWLITKLGLLFLYILLGHFALKPTKITWLQPLAFMSALLTFSAIISLAIFKPF